MAINLEAMRAKQALLDNDKNNNNDRKSAFWKPVDGDQDIRIVCPEDGDPFKELHFHYLEVDGKRKTVLCPKRNFDDECPICEFASSLWRDAVAANNDEMKRQAKDMFVKQRYFSPVLVRGEEDEGVRAWGYGVTAYKKLLQLVLNPEYGDITDVDEGTDLTITYGKVAGKRFPETNISPRRRTSILCNDAVGGADRCADLLNNIPNIDKLFTRISPQEAQNILDQVLASGGEGTEEVHYNKTAAPMDDIEAAYKQLMNS
jgi:hypothetical protein